MSDFDGKTYAFEVNFGKLNLSERVPVKVTGPDNSTFTFEAKFKNVSPEVLPAPGKFLMDTLKAQNMKGFSLHFTFEEKED